ADGRGHRQLVDVLVVVRRDADGVSLAADIENARNHIERVVEAAAVLVDREHRRQLLAAEAMLLTDLLLLDDDERLAFGELEARLPCDDVRGARDRVDRPSAFGVPHDRLELRLLLVAREVTALFLQRIEKRVVHARLDDQIAVARAAGAVVLRLADSRVPRRLRDVRGLVDDHRRVARADAVGRLAGAVRGLDHRGAARRDGQIADRHELLREGDARLLDALHQVLRRAELLQYRTQDARDLERRVLAQRMRRENDRVTTLRRIDGHVDHRDERVRHGQNARDHADRLRVLDDAFLGDLFDDADALRAKRVAQNAEDLPAARGHAFGAAHAG